MAYHPPAEPTYTVAENGKSILCLKCGRRSHNENYVRHRYCGACGWHDVSAKDDQRVTLAALLARAKVIAGNARNPRVTEMVEQASALIDAELTMEALENLAGSDGG